MERIQIHPFVNRRQEAYRTVYQIPHPEIQRQGKCQFSKPKPGPQPLSYSPPRPIGNLNPRPKHVGPQELPQSIKKTCVITYDPVAIICAYAHGNKHPYVCKAGVDT